MPDDASAGDVWKFLELTGEFWPAERTMRDGSTRLVDLDRLLSAQQQQDRYSRNDQL